MPSNAKQTRLYFVWDTSADFTAKTGISSANLFGPTTNDGVLVSLKQPKRGGFVGPHHAIILEDGPIWDCMSTGTNLIVSQRLKDFLEKRTKGDLAFLPMVLKDEEGKRTVGSNYGVIFKKVLKAITNYSVVDREMIACCGHAAMRVRDKKDDCWSRFLIDADLADEMIANRFTGLGFKNRFSARKPGRIGNRPRYFPEKELMDQYIRDRPSLLIEKVASSAKSIRKGWQALLKEARAIQPAGVYEGLESLDVENDLAAQLNWLKLLLQSDPPAKSIGAFWFGLFDRTGEKKGESLATLYASGSDRYEPESRYDFEWAVKPKWFPELRYTHSTTLNAVSRAAHQTASEEVRQLLSYVLTLGFASLLVRFTFERISKRALKLLGSKRRAIAVGFDSGDGVFVGTVSAGGWKKS